MRTFTKTTPTGYQAGFTIDNQTFYLQENETLEDAEWFRKMLDKAFKKVI